MAKRDSDDQDVKVVASVDERRASARPAVSTGAPEVIHETSRKRVLVTPFFIRRTDRDQVSFKIQDFRKEDAPRDWVLRKEGTISLDEKALGRLGAFIARQQALAATREDGRYITLKIDSDDSIDLDSISPSDLTRALVHIFKHGDIAEYLLGQELGHQLVEAVRATMKLSELRHGVAELRQLLDEGVATERVYQAWCERHTWAFGNVYVARDEIRNISTSDQVDLLLPALHSNLREIVELKRPDMEVIRWDKTHRNWYFSADTSMAIGQCHRYLDTLHTLAQKGLLDYPDIVAYHPRATIVIGRSQGWTDEQIRGLHGLNTRLNQIAVMTYDHLLAQGERLLAIVSSDRGGEHQPIVDDDDGQGTDIADDGFYDDDLPF